MKDFLPVNVQDCKNRGWNEVDFVYVTGDAYVDHPSFGVAIISRVLEAEGFKVAILSQPNWKKMMISNASARRDLAFLLHREI